MSSGTSSRPHTSTRHVASSRSRGIRSPMARLDGLCYRRDDHRQTSTASDLHDPGDRNAPAVAVLQRLLRRGRHRAGRRARDLLRVPGAQRRGEVDHDQDADGPPRPFRRADDRAGAEHARSARGARGEAPHGGHPGGPGAVRQPDGARVSHVRRPHPPDAAGHDPQPQRRAALAPRTCRTRRRSSRWNTRTA